MGKIELETIINAPIGKCFDLARNIDAHIKSTQQTNEKAIAGKTTGLVELGDIVTWEATHFQIRQRLTVKITKFVQPKYFQDCQIRGIFKSLTHDHFFNECGTSTKMKDVLEFECPFGPLGYAADPFVKSHLKRFLLQRNNILKQLAEDSDRTT